MKNKSQRHKESNTFKFQPFAERIANINIDIFHRVGHEYETQDEEDKCLFYQAILKWDVLNLSEPYSQFRREVAVHNLITLPQLIHKKDHVAEVLLKHLRYKNILCLQALLDLVVSFANDLRKDFYQFYPDFFAVIIDLLNTKETDQLEWTFTCLAYLFKFLWRPLIKEVKTVFTSLLPLLSEHKPDYINDFAAQSFAFIVRKVKDWHGFLTLLLKVVRSSGDATIGCGKLLFEVINGVGGQFHSCAETVLPFLITSFEYDAHLNTVYEVVEEVVANICTRIKPQKTELFWKVCISAITNWFDIHCQYSTDILVKCLESSLKLLGQAIEYKSGKLLTSPVPIVNLIIRMLSFEGNPDKLLVILSQISILILVSENVRLPQEQASALISRVLSIPRILLHFVDHVKSYTAFEALVLPTFLQYCIANNLSEDCLRVLAKLILHKSPLCGSGVNLDSWVKYPLELKDANSRVLDLVRVADANELLINTDDYLCGLICLSHLNEDKVEVGEVLSNNMKLLCCNIEAGFDKRKQLYLLLVTLEIAVRVAPAGIVQHFDLIVTSVLPLCVHSDLVSALKVLDLYLSAISGDKLISFDLLLKLHQTLSVNFNSPFHEMRLHTAHIYTLFAHLPELNRDDAVEWKVFNLCYNVEAILPQVETYRDQLQNLEQLSFGKPQMNVCKETEFKTIPLRYLCGVLYMNFQLLWEPTIKIIATHADGLDLIDFCDVFLAELKASVVSVNEPLQRLENVLESDCEFLQDLYRSVNRLDMKPDFGNYRQLLWKALTYFPDVAERRTRDVSNLFLAFIEDEYVKANGEIAFRWNIKENESETSLNRNLDDTTEDDTSGKKSSAKLKGLNKLKILLHHLTIFNKVRNPKGMYREPELYKTYYDLLSHKNHDVQRLALDCIMTYKNKSLTPYREHLYNLINEKNVKEELATFRVDTDSSIVQTEHREHLIPVVLNIVYSKMFAKTGLRTGGKSSSQLRRNLVLRFLAGCERSEMLSFIRMTFRFYSKFFEDDLLVMCDNISRNVDLENVIPPKRLQSTLNLLTIVFEHFGGLGGDELLSFLLKVLFTIGATLKGVYRQLSAVHGGYLAILRNLRVSALKIVGRFFEHFETYPWSASEINSVFSVFVWPYLDKLTTEGIHSPTALLKLFVHWGSNPRYFPLLVKHQPGNLTQYVLPHVANLLINNQSNVSVKNVILEMFEKLLSFESNEDEAQLKIPVDDVLPIQEHILEKLKVRDLNYGSCIVLPHVPAVLEVIKRKLSAKFQKLNQREIFVLSRISELIWEPAISGEVLTLLLPLTLTKCSEGEELVMKYVTTVSNLLQNVTEPQQHLEQLSPLFAYVSYASCRKILSTSLETISKQSQDPKLSTLASVVGQLNACDEKFVDQPNFDRRLAGFKQVQLLIDGDALDLTLGVYVVYNCWYLLSNETDLSLKENAAHCWKNVSVILIKKYGDSAKELNYVLNDILFDIIRQGLKSKEDVCGECISLLGYLARECPTANVVLSDFNKIANKEDVEVDFFENLIHLQVHRQERALLKFCLVFNKAEAPHCRTLTQFVLPLTSIYLCSEKYSGNNKIINAAVKVLRTVCKLLPWHQYEGVLKFYVNKLHRDFVYQKQLVKIMVAILDAFHFDLSKGHVGVVKVERGDLKVMAKVEKTEVEGKIETGEDDGENNTSQDDETNAVKEEEMLEESVDEVEEVVKSSNSVLVLNRSSATKVIRTIQLVLLPQLHKALAEMTKHDKLHKVNRKKVSFEKEEEDLSRIPISLAVVKLLQQLPKEILDANIPRVFMKLCTFLKSHMENVRQVARETLQKIMLNLGPTYLPSLLNEMTSILSRGYQVHVLIFTVHAVLVSLKDKFRPTDIDAILLPVIDICKNELFGNMAEEKEVTQIVKKVSEAKSVKSFDTYHILAQYISDRCFLDLILSLKELLATSHSFKVINKVRECLRCIALGLVENTFISTESLLKFSYGTSSESIPELLSNTENLEPEVTGKQLLEKQKPDCFIIPPLPVGKSGIRLSGVKTSSKTNAHVLVEFGLNLCNHLLTKEKCKGDEFKPFLDPFIPIFKNCLSSRHVKLSTLTLQCLYRIMVYDLPSLRGNIKELTNIMFEILHKYASAGLGKGDNFDLVLAAFKAMAVVVREKYYKITSSQLKILLLYIEQDLNNHDRQAIAFTLLKAIILKKLMTAEMHSVMRQVSELSITSEMHHVRVQARSVFYQFLMNYPLKKKLEAHIAFYVSQIKYGVQSGRESALEMIHTFINSFPVDVLVQYSGTFLVTLGAQLVNEEVVECRKMIANCLTDLFKRLPRPDCDPLFDIVILWLEDEKILHRELAAQVCGLLVAVEKSSFETRLLRLIPVIFAQFEKNTRQPGQYVLIKANEVDEDVDERRAKDHHLFQVFQMLLKICAHCAAFLNRTIDIQTLADYSQNLLSYPHEWVRLGAAQFLGFVLNSLDIEKLSDLLQSKENADIGYLYSAPVYGLKSLTLDLVAQLQPECVKTDLAEQVIKNLLFVARVLQKIPLQKEAEEKNLNLLWLTKTLRRTVNAEIIRTPSCVIVRTAVFKWIAAVTTVLELESVLGILYHLLAPLAREMVTTLDSNVSLRQLSKEVGNMLRNKVGIELYTETLSKVEQRAELKKSERKRESSQLAITDPESFAKKKIKLNEKRRELKKRKAEVRKGVEKKVKKRKVVDFDHFDIM